MRLVLALAFLPLGLARADVVEDVVDVPVTVRTMFGREVSQSIKVTVFRDDSRPNAPWLVLNHGRPPTPADFVKMSRQRFSAISRYFVSRGFVVLVPTRIGYGASEGPDVEASGRCDNKNFPPASAAAADQVVAVAKAATAMSYVDASRGIVVGTSVGGMTSVAVAARDLPGLVATINVSGGAGGDPERHPADPCGVRRLVSLYADYGFAARVPTLWLYSENDRYWGAEWPRKWFDAFAQAGGKGRFVPLPPFKDNGHMIFVGDPGAWQPAVESFLRQLGF